MLRIVLLGEGEERNGSKGEGMTWDDMYADSLNQVRVVGCVCEGGMCGVRAQRGFIVPTDLYSWLYEYNP